MTTLAGATLDTDTCWYSHILTAWKVRKDDVGEDWGRRTEKVEYRHCRRPGCDEYQERPA